MERGIYSDHEGHRQKTNLRVGDPIKFGSRTGDGSIGDPQHLHGEVDEHEHCQYHPAIAIYPKGLILHEFASDLFLLWFAFAQVQ